MQFGKIPKLIIKWPGPSELSLPVVVLVVAYIHQLSIRNKEINEGQRWHGRIDSVVSGMGWYRKE